MSDVLAKDPRTAEAGAGENLSLSEDQAKALLQELGPREDVLAVYHNGWGRVVLAENGLILLRGIVKPVAIRVPVPLQILRPTYGMSDSVDVLVLGHPYKLWGSKLDPKGELLMANGDMVPPGSPLRPGRRTRLATWVGRHPVLMIAAVFGLFFAVLGPGSTSPGDDKEAVAQKPEPASVVVPDFSGSPLAEAALTAGRHQWQTVSAADASSDRRSVTTTTSGWQVCFQNPSHEEKVRPSSRTLTLYAVPKHEECPVRLHGSRRILMPALVGEQADDASRALDDLGLRRVVLFHAHTGKRLTDGLHDVADWRVCRQYPEPDTEISAGTQADLWLIGPSKSCAEPSPDPKPEPKPDPKPKPKPRPRPSNGSGAGGGSTGGSSGNSSGGTTGGGGSSGSSTSGGSSGTTGGGTGGTGSRPGVQFGQFCSPVGAIATTTDGRPAKCFMGKDGNARWGYNSG